MDEDNGELPGDKQLVAEYEAGATTRELAARYGRHESVIRQRLHRGGARMRPRGTRQRVDPAEVRRARHQTRSSWRQIAHELGVSRNAAQQAYRRATDGARGDIDHFEHLTAKQEERLRMLWNSVPPQANGGPGRAVLTSVEGKQLREQLSNHHRAGVTYKELGMAIGMSAPSINRIIKGE